MSQFFPRIFQILLSLTAFLFIAQQVSLLSFLHLESNNTPFYSAFFLLGSLSLFLIGKKSTWQPLIMLRAGLVFFLPIALIFAFGISWSQQFHFLVFLCVGLYAITAFLYWVYLMSQTDIFLPPSGKSEKHNKRTLISVFLATLFFFSFGLTNLAQFAAVDEPLWMDGRITRFWKNLAERDFEKTDVSDKPGITVAIASGPGLLFVTPKDYRDARFIFAAKNQSLNIEDYFLAFRLPLLITITLFLPFFYFLLVPLIGSGAALLGYIALTLSPILIGMSKIVNPDSLLWIFAPLSLLAYLVFLEKKTLRTLLLSGIFLGLALLTKYVANFLIVFFFGYIFLRYITEKNDLAFPEYFKQSLITLGIWLGAGLSVFYLILPALWLAPEKLFTSTIFSQAFEKVAPLFIALVSLLLIDQYFFKARATTWTLTQLQKIQRPLEHFFIGSFLLILFFVLLNGMLGMPWVDFMQVLASPKSIYQVSDAINLFLTNFYPLFFGVPTLVLFGILITLFTTWWGTRSSSPQKRFVLASIVFILLYSFASAVNQVVLINRYQIMLYPILSILGGIGLFTLFHYVEKKLPAFLTYGKKYTLFVGATFIVLVAIMFATPFPLSFSNSLLPIAYTTDIKDMGSGSYEAAAYLNSLPEAKNLVIWTDKKGVCKFFVGTCIDGFNFSVVPASGLDYVVISAGRESRTERMMANPYLLNDEGLVRYDTYYEKSNPEWELLINGRPGQFVKIFPFDTSL